MFCSILREFVVFEQVIFLPFDVDMTDCKGRQPFETIGWGILMKFCCCCVSYRIWVCGVKRPGNKFEESARDLCSEVLIFLQAQELPQVGLRHFAFEEG